MKQINKYWGLVLLKDLDIPCVHWVEYYSGSKLSDGYLWTVRVATKYGFDMNLPCSLGVTSNQAQIRAEEYLINYDLVVVSEYFFADISGVLSISYDNFFVEWIHGDSREITRDGKFEESNEFRYTTQNFQSKLSPHIQRKLYGIAYRLRYIFRDELLQGKRVVLEWSTIALPECNICDKYAYKKGELIFYDFRML